MKLRQRDIFTRLVRTRPLFLAALLYLTGCILAHFMPPAPVFFGAGALVMLLGGMALHKNYRRIACALLALCFLPLGACLFHLNWQRYDPFPEQIKASLSGRICENPTWKEDTQRTICVLDKITVNGEELSGKLRLYLRGDTELLQNVSLGQSISCTAHIWQAEKATNPGEFDFDRYLRLNGLSGYATAEIEEALLGQPSFRKGDGIQKTRLYLSGRIDSLFEQNAAIAKAFLLGDRSELSSDERAAYNLSGAGHLLAISGMHVSVLAMFITLLLQRFISRRSAFIITLVFLLAYGMLIGFSASLLRAILMFAVFHSASIFGRHSDAPTRLAAAMLLYLLIRPIAILEAGFILSYGAAAGIIFLKCPLARLLHLEKILHAKPRNGFKAIFTNRLPHWLAQSILVSLAAQLAILPGVVHFFGAQPLWSLLANLLVVPLAMLAYVLSLITAIIGLKPLCLIPDFLFGLLTDCVAFFAKLPLSSLKIARFPLWLVLICLVACFFASDLSKIPEKIRRFLPLTVILAALISNLCAALTATGCSIVFLDAGEADCAVIRTEGKIYLIDTGDGYSPAADYISAMNYDVSAVFLSHPHSDHAGGLIELLKVCTPERIYTSSNWNQAEIDEETSLAMEAAMRQGVEIISLSAGDTLSLSDKTLLEVLSPQAGIPASSANDDSMILRVSHGNCTALFTGDASAETTCGKPGDIDIIKVAHHGAKDGINADLLIETSPSAAVLPVGYNTYGHPAQKTLDLLESAGCAIYRTDHHGAITCCLHPDGSIAVRTYHSSEEIHGME